MTEIKPRLIRKSFAFYCLTILTILTTLSVALATSAAASAQAQKGQPLNCAGGSPDAPIRMEIFSDFQCSWCRAFYLETVTQVLKNYSPADKICVVYYEFPLDIHAYSRKAAHYSLAAQRVGKKQWLAVIDALYTKQAQWASDGNIDAIIKAVVSTDDFDRIKKLLQDPSIEEELSRDIALGQKRGVDGTPSIFLTALNHQQPKYPYVPYQVLKDYFDSIVK